jgi:two-component system CAI-1 autoinducer sensor kinase/phosphatase CqsS
VNHHIAASIAALDRDVLRSYRYVKNHGVMLGMIIVISFPLGGLSDIYLGKANYNPMPIRLFAVALCLPCFFFNRFPASRDRKLAYYWLFLTSALLCFVFGLIFLSEAALTPLGEELPIYWYVEYLVALFIFTQLASSVWLASAAWALSSLLAVAIVSTYCSVNWNQIQVAFIQPLGAYLTAVCLGSLTNRNLEVGRLESLAAARSIGSNIAHELRTPLMSIAMRARAARQLLDSHEKSHASRVIEDVEESFDDIEKEAHYAHTMVEMLLVNTSERPIGTYHREIVQISSILDDAIHRYPFNNDDQRKLVNLRVDSDFWISVPPLLITHVFFNLIKNAIYFIEESGRGKLEIRVTEGGRVEFTDTGPGINPNDLGRVFDRFFTTANSGQGNGIGLSFCKAVMEGIGGSIKVTSQVSKFTQFCLSFPTTTAPPARN